MLTQAMPFLVFGVVLAVPIASAAGVVLSICSEADAFVAASLTQFSLAARLVFLTVGPMIDLKLFAMQAGIFGRRFAVRFAPATFVLATVLDYAARAVFDQGHSLTDRRIELSGFRTAAPDGSWYLTRMILTCCAADAGRSRWPSPARSRTG